MLLSKPQKQLLSLLKSTGGLREDQARQLLKMEYGNLRWDPLVHQLMIDRYIYFYNHERIQFKTGEAPLARRLSA